MYVDAGRAGSLPATIGAIIAVLFVLAVVILIIVLAVVFYRRSVPQCSNYSLQLKYECTVPKQPLIQKEYPWSE